MRKKAARLRNARRLERLGWNCVNERKIVFRYHGIRYAIFCTEEMGLLVTVDGRLVNSPAKAILKNARSLLAMQDVEFVHKL